MTTDQLQDQSHETRSTLFNQRASKRAEKSSSVQKLDGLDYRHTVHALMFTNHTVDKKPASSLTRSAVDDSHLPVPTLMGP